MSEDMIELSPPAATIVAHTQAAVLDDSLWPDWAERMVRYLDGGGGTMFVLDARTSELHRIVPVWKSARVESDYFGHFWQSDPLIPLVARAARPLLLGNASHLDETDPATAEYMRWCRGVGDFDEHVLAVTPLGETAFRAGISVHKPTGSGPFSEAQRHSLQMVFPEMIRAMGLAFQNSELLEEGYWDGIRAMVDPDAGFLLAEDGKLIRMNEAASSIIAAGDSLVVRDDRLSCAVPEACDALISKIAAALRDLDARSAAMLIPSNKGRQPLAATIHPLARQRRWLAPFQAAALVRVNGQVATNDRFGFILADLFHLSAREAELSKLLCQGHSPESAATVLGITLGTCRVHLRHIFAKTRTTRQGELIALILRVTR